MVSFQCNKCADVVTKPKLDKHRAKCLASFDCIDCSQRFETPTDYKGHTSCVTEAEKYQKASYKGGSAPERNGRTPQWRQQGGGRPRGDNRQRWQQRNVNQATGANDTPLGTPVRMSPVNDSPSVEGDLKKMQPKVETEKKRKAETEATEFQDTPKPAKKQKTIKDTQDVVKSSTKRKSTLEVAAPEEPLHDGDIQPAENENTLQEGEKKKQKKKKESEANQPREGEKEVKKDKEKKKKKKKKESEAKQTIEDEKEVKKDKKEKKRKRKDSSPAAEEPGSIAMLNTKATVAAQPPVTEDPLKINPEKEKRRSTKKVKSKSKSKLKVPAKDETPGVTASTQSTAADFAGEARNDPEGNRKKKSHSGNHNEDSGDSDLVAPGNGTSKEKRSERKKKRKSAGHTVSVVE